MKLFLSSALYTMKDELITFFWDLSWKKIAYITNPADEILEARWWIASRIEKDKEMLISCKIDLISIDLKTYSSQDLWDCLLECDWIYVSGGNAAYFMELAKKSGYAQLLPDLLTKHNKIYMSTSAWSCVMWEYIREYDDQENVINILPWRWWYASMLIPHRWYASSRFKNKYLWKNIETMYDFWSSCLTLTDNQAIVVDDAWMKIISNKNLLVI